MDFGRRGEYAPKCMRGHGLEKKAVAGAHRITEAKHCSLCNTALTQGSIRWSCKPCGFHLCPSCHEAARQRLIEQHCAGCRRSATPAVDRHHGYDHGQQRPNLGAYAVPYHGTAPQPSPGSAADRHHGQQHPIIGAYVTPYQGAAPQPSPCGNLVRGSPVPKEALGGYVADVRRAVLPEYPPAVAKPQHDQDSKDQKGRPPATRPSEPTDDRDHGGPSHWFRWKHQPSSSDWARLVPVDRSVAKLLAQSIQVGRPAELGKGRDSSSYDRKYSNLRFHWAWQVQQKDLWQLYELRRDMVARQVRLLEEKGFARPELTVRKSRIGAILPGGLNNDANEHFFLTGVQPANVLPIAQQGLQVRLGLLHGAFGAGIYLAEEVEKCDQYVTPDRGQVDVELADLHTRLFTSTGLCHPGEDLFYCFAVRATLGWTLHTVDGRHNLYDPAANVYENDERRELATICGSSPPLRYNSLVVELGAAVKRFREFVIFESTQCYAEYLIAFTRVSDAENAGRQATKEPGT